MATNIKLMVSQLEGIKKAIKDKWGDDGLKKKPAFGSLSSAEQRLWQELVATSDYGSMVYLATDTNILRVYMWSDTGASAAYKYVLWYVK